MYAYNSTKLTDAVVALQVYDKINAHHDNLWGDVNTVNGAFLLLAAVCFATLHFDALHEPACQRDVAVCHARVSVHIPRSDLT